MFNGNASKPEVCVFTASGFAHRMAGSVHVVMRLLLLCLIPPGVYEVEDLVFARRGYVRYSCEDKVCVHIWKVSNLKDYVVIVSNGSIQTHKSEYDGSECPLKIKDLRAEDIGRHSCYRTPTYSAPVLSLMPGKTLSLQCSFLTDRQNRCFTKLQERVTMTWVDEAGDEIRGSRYQIKRQTFCDITLTVIFQSPESKKFRCQMAVAREVRTSAELHVKVSAVKGRGRGLMEEMDQNTKAQGSNGDVVAAVALGVVGCAALTAIVALFVVNRRRTSRQLPNESSYTPSANDGMNRDDVIYADILFPVGSNRACVHEWDSTEYACIQYK